MWKENWSAQALSWFQIVWSMIPQPSMLSSLTWFLTSRIRFQACRNAYYSDGAASQYKNHKHICQISVTIHLIMDLMLNGTSSQPVTERAHVMAKGVLQTGWLPEQASKLLLRTKSSAHSRCLTGLIETSQELNLYGLVVMMFKPMQITSTWVKGLHRPKTTIHAVFHSCTQLHRQDRAQRQYRK